MPVRREKNNTAAVITIAVLSYLLGGLSVAVVVALMMPSRAVQEQRVGQHANDVERAEEMLDKHLQNFKEKTPRKGGK